MKRRTWCGILVLTGAWTLAWAAEDSPYERVATGRRPAPKDDARVYTNEDLERLVWIAVDEDRDAAAPAAGVADKPTAAPASALPDPLEWLKQRQAAKAEHAAQLAAAVAAVAAAEQRVANLEKQALAVRNPFSARPQLSDEEKKARAAGGETGVERAVRTDSELEQAREELRAARAKVAELRASAP